MVPCPRDSEGSGGQKKLTRVECDKCCHNVFRMGDSILVCHMTEVSLAFMSKHPFHGTSFHAFLIQYLSLMFLLPDLLFVESSSLPFSTLKVIICFYSLLSTQGGINWTSGLRTFLTELSHN